MKEKQEEHWINMQMGKSDRQKKKTKSQIQDTLLDATKPEETNELRKYSSIAESNASRSKSGDELVGPGHLHF